MNCWFSSRFNQHLQWLPQTILTFQGLIDSLAPLCYKIGED